MPEHLLRELADEAPTLRPGFADEILHAARRRVRRRWTVLGAVAAAAVVTVGIPVAIDTARGPAPAPALRGTSSSADTTSASPMPTFRALPGRFADPAGMYVAVVRYAADHPDTSARVERVLVVDAVCTGAADASLTGCAGPLPAGTHDAVVAAVPIASFVAAPPRVSPADPPDPTRIWVLLGPVQRTGAVARVWVEQTCGFNCVRGDQLVLALRNGVWTVTGARGMYIS